MAESSPLREFLSINEFDNLVTIRFIGHNDFFGLFLFFRRRRWKSFACTSKISGFYDLIYAVVAALAIAVGAALTASITIIAAPIGSHILIKVIV